MTRPRLQLDFSPEAIERLDKLRELTQSKDKAEVVKNSLRLYEWFVRQQKDGWKVQLVQDDKIREIELLFGGME